MHDDASPFFIAPHRFDAPDDDVGPVLDRRHELALDPGERVLHRHRLHAEGYLLDPTEGWRCWGLPDPVAVTVTDRRVAYVGAGSQMSVVGVAGDARHRRGVRMPGLVSGQIRWQWPSRLEVLPADPGGTARLLVVCDALRTIRQPALALAGPVAEIVELAERVRRAVAEFRLLHPDLVDLSPPERDVLALRVRPAPPARAGRITLPGSLPVEFHSRDDYYRPHRPDRAWPGPAADAASGHR
ncbi:hypothetical protein [Micromonospora endolithica]|uniref:Uncharacterized protein n=1 Tax=Micromonospora endolithica TaxID=230091 RepID=A0A3A9Z1B2_9ACTN|nr:hypothetical protein [Micromonospora endolithica]RKN42161.1 hypothetical protein D7223_23310 [Micromonospora endolithica]TWJ26314.1 hypothetical protein JD76_06495 [Micromonospora endolithica]